MDYPTRQVFNEDDYYAGDIGTYWKHIREIAGDSYEVVEIKCPVDRGTAPPWYTPDICFAVCRIDGAPKSYQLMSLDPLTLRGSIRVHAGTSGDLWHGWAHNGMLTTDANRLSQSPGLDLSDVHTCHAGCPCQHGGEPLPDFP